MTKNSKIPAVRFAGFNEAWKERKLGEVVARITRKNEDLESTLPLTISAQYGLIDQNEFFEKRIASKDVSGYFLVRKGEFAYNKSTSNDAPWGAIKRLDKYESGVLSTLYIVFSILDESKTSSDYVVTYYDTDLWHKGIQAIAAEGARNHGLLNIVPLDFFETSISIPKDVAEQTKIGTYFKNLDALITLQQKKCEQLANVKKSMLEKMFPKKGSKVPEIRFAGFEGEWEERKLGEVCSGFEYGLNVAATVYDGRNKYIRITDIDDASHRFNLNNVTSPDTDLSVADNYRLLINDLLFARTGASVGKTYLYRESDGMVYFAGFLIRAKVNSENDAEFIFQNTITDEYNQFIRISSQRSGQPGVNAQEYADYNLMIPAKAEQTKIGTYFRTLDTLITLQRRKLDKLKNIKKSLLQKMFV